jgi:hypothetical protein
MIKIGYTLFILLICCNVTAGELFFINKSGNPSLENVINNTIINEFIVLGKTYSIDGTNAYTITTSVDDSVSTKFSNDLSIKLYPNTTISLNTVDHTILNTVPYPEKLLYTNSLSSISLLQGQINVINDGNPTNINYISTGQVKLILGTGKFIIKSEKNMTMVVCIDGSVKAVDKLNTTHSESIITNTILLVIPSPILSGKASGLIKHQSIYSTSEILPDQLTSYKESLNFDYQSVIFIAVNGKVYGLKK